MSDRDDRENRQITFHVDSGASKAVVKKSHPAVRGYKIHKDSETGHKYATAGKETIVDGGRRLLAPKCLSGEKQSKIPARVVGDATGGD